MEIELLENGGVANLHRRLVLNDRHLSLSDRRGVHLEKQIGAKGQKRLRGLIDQLLGREPKRRYGGAAGMISDPAKIRLRIKTDNGKPRVIEVRSDPSDPPPPAFRAVVRALHELSQNGERASKAS